MVYAGECLMYAWKLRIFCCLVECSVDSCFVELVYSVVQIFCLFLDSLLFYHYWKWSAKVSKYYCWIVYVLPLFDGWRFRLLDRVHQEAKKGKILSRIVYKVMEMKGGAKISLVTSQQWSKRETWHAWFWRGISSQLMLNIPFYFLK